MAPHLIWAFVVLCAIGAAVWLRVRHERESDLCVLERTTAARAEALNSVVSLHHSDIVTRLDAIEADLKPIKAKHAAGEFSKLGGAR